MVSQFCSYLFLCLSRLWNGSVTESYNFWTVSRAFISFFEKYIEIYEYLGHPSTVFCKLSLPRSKYCLEFSITWGGLKILLDDRSIHVQFSKLIKYISCDFLEFDFSHFIPQVRLFCVRKRKPKIFGFKNVIERGIKKLIFFFVMR